MKLLTIINRLYLTNLLIVLLIGGMAGFFIIRTSINNEFNKKLIAEKDQLIKEIKKNPNVKEGYFILTTNSIFLNTTPENQTDPIFSAIYNLSFHGDSRFSAISNISELPSGLLYSFYCDKQS